jgi:protein subunit release factor A
MSKFEQVIQKAKRRLLRLGTRMRDIQDASSSGQIRLVHIPLGIVVESRIEHSKGQSLAGAWQRLAEKVFELKKPAKALELMLKRTRFSKN